MSGQALDRYREALERQAEVEKALIDRRVDVLVIEKEFELAAKPSGPPKSTTEQFIEEHRGDLEPEDLEFMSVNFRGAGEVSRHTEIPLTSLKRLADAGKIEIRKTESGHRRYSTVSVVRYLIDQKESP